MKQVMIMVIMVSLMACGETREKPFQEITEKQLRQEIYLTPKEECIWRYKSDKFYYYFTCTDIPSDKEVTIFAPIKIVKKFKLKKELLSLPESNNFTLLKQSVKIH